MINEIQSLLNPVKDDYNELYEKIKNSLFRKEGIDLFFEHKEDFQINVKYSNKTIDIILNLKNNNIGFTMFYDKNFKDTKSILAQGYSTNAIQNILKENHTNVLGLRKYQSVVSLFDDEDNYVSFNDSIWMKIAKNKYSYKRFQQVVSQNKINISIERNSENYKIINQMLQHLGQSTITLKIKASPHLESQNRKIFEYLCCFNDFNSLSSQLTYVINTKLLNNRHHWTLKDIVKNQKKFYIQKNKLLLKNPNLKNYIEQSLEIQKECELKKQYDPLINHLKNPLNIAKQAGLLITKQKTETFYTYLIGLCALGFLPLSNGNLLVHNYEKLIKQQKELAKKINNS